MSESPVRVLMVEDNRLDTMLVTSTLEAMKSWSVQIAVVEDGQQALQYLAQEGSYGGAARPDLVLLDLNLPKHDGLEVLRFLRSKPELEKIKVFVFSSSPVEIMQTQVQSAQLEADQYFTKPFQVQDFETLGNAIQSSYLSGGGRNGASIGS